MTAGQVSPTAGLVLEGESAPVAVPADVDNVDDRFLRAALGLPGVTRLAAEQVGIGHMSDTYRLTLSGAPWPELILKINSTDPDSRMTAIRHRTYEIEVGFYQLVAPHVDVRIPTCHWAGFEPRDGRYAILLESVTGTRTGDQIIGCSPDEAAGALAELAPLHAQWWGDRSLAHLPWMRRYENGYRAANLTRAQVGLPDFLARFTDRLSPEAAELTESFAGQIHRYDRRGLAGPRTVGHGDFRADNLLFGQHRVCLIDWQTTFLGNGLVDVSYFLGGSLTVSDRREHEKELVRGYHERIVRAGVQLSWEECWRTYRRHSFEGLAMALVAAPAVKRSSRGDDMFAVMTERACQHVLDMAAGELLDPPS
ncbi:MAG TPA: phosphotransferase [Pseudonocardia sp.]|nr:phosphotransferase [Pseudonocardia sp.]